eukprot:scaffold27030_cov132-Cylindrotheca_fusiformis.AAC.1
MRKVPLVIHVVDSGSSISQISLEDSRQRKKRSSSKRTANAKWAIGESSSSAPKRPESTELHITKASQSTQVRKPARKDSKDLLDLSIIAKRSQTAKHMPQLDRQRSCRTKNPADGYWAWDANKDASTVDDNTMDDSKNGYRTWNEQPIIQGMGDSRWSVMSASSSRRSIESSLTLLPQRNKSRSQSVSIPSMPLTMPKRKSSVQNNLNDCIRGRHTNSSSSLAHNASFGRLPRHL